MEEFKKNNFNFLKKFVGKSQNSKAFRIFACIMTSALEFKH